MTQQKYTNQNAFCPLCGATEVNEATDKLNVRGFKVGDKYGWWSHCLLEHLITLDDVDYDIPSSKKIGDNGGIWFVWYEKKSKWLLSFPFINDDLHCLHPEKSVPF